ncbi:helix-turn-helix domain-containing protein [Halorubrum sp. RMP-47]|uniref:Helix-turn-helix domain-containing protein n=1 Tax=Halorubrum miltondacostae TaxID=3076378 RepID=A0ABD5M3P9_9EURY
MSSRTESQADLSASGRTERELSRRGVAADEPELSVTSPTREEVLRTVFSLGEQDIRTYDAVAEETGATTSELGDHLDRDRSNVNRSLKRLRETGLVTRSRRLLDEGGHVYQYYTADTESGDPMAQAVDRWRSAALDAIASE